MDSPLIVAADREAAEAIENHEAWQAVHDRWQARTQRDLSPASFGQRILNFRENAHGRTTSAQTSYSSHTSTPQLSAALPQRTPSNSGTSLQPPRPDTHSRSASNALPNGSHNTATAPPQAPPAHRPTSSTPTLPSILHREPAPASDPTQELERADIARLDAAMGSLQREMAVIRQELGAVQQELMRRPLHSDPTTLDALSETVHSVSVKAGEVDGLRFQIEVLKQRIKSLEDVPRDLNMANTLAPIAAVPTRLDSGPQYAPSPPQQQQPPQQLQQPQPQNAASSRLVSSGGWNAVNTDDPLIKRKGSPDHGDSLKRARQDRPSLPPLSQAIPDPYTPQANHIAPRDNYSQESWHSKSLPTSAARGVSAGRGRGRPPGRPRNNDYGTASWEGEDWQGSEAPTANDYYLYTSPGNDRGRLVRRGTGGTFTEEPGRRTRQKPTRNAQGILIRKDGKPDQRSISSAMNLKKVHARKLAELDGVESGSPHEGSATTDSPGAETHHLSTSRRASPDVEDTPMQMNKSHDTAPGHARTSSDSARRDPHHRVMNQMFPNGVSTDAQNANHAAHIFASTNSEQRVQPRSEMVKEDTAASASVESAGAQALH